MAQILNITTEGTAELRQTLSDAAARLADPHDLLDAIGATLVSNTERRFDTKRDPDGKPWAPWAPSTRAKYDRRDTMRSGPRSGEVARAGSLLEGPGRLMRGSLTHNVGDGFVDVGMNRETKDGRWSIPMLHEFGTARMPRRGMLTSDPNAGTLGAQDVADIHEDVRAFLDDIFGA